MYPIALSLGRSVSPAAVEPLVKFHSEKPKVLSLNFVAGWLRWILQQDVIKLRVLRPNVFKKGRAWCLNTFKIDGWWIWRILRKLLYWIKDQKNKGVVFMLSVQTRHKMNCLYGFCFSQCKTILWKGYVLLKASLKVGHGWVITSNAKKIMLLSMHTQISVILYQ